MLKIRRLIGILLLATLVACSGGGDDESFGTTVPPVVEEPDPDPDVPVIPDATTIDALTSNPQLQSDGGIPVTISALVKDVNNNFIEGASVVFSSDTGSLQPINLITGTDGLASALLTTAGEPENRVITVTATTGELTDTVSVTVIGTMLQLTGPTSLAQGATATYTLVLNNADGTGIDGETVTVSSSLGNTLSAQTLTTDSSGQAQFDYTAVNGGTDLINAMALGESTSSNVTIADDSFSFISPSANTEIDLGASQSVTLRWSQNNVPVSGQSVNFAATRGTVTPSSVVTNGSGEATVSISALNAGIATITANTSNGPTASLLVEFVATTPDTVEVQADPFTIDPNSQSAITAIVRDPDGNLVKNVVVNFDVVDITGGSLSVPSAVTDSQGRAQTFYTSSSQTSSVDGVEITANIGSSISDTVFLTVAGRAVFFSFGTGNELFEPNPAQYQSPYVVQVTDADGRPVIDTDVVMSITSVKYVKGYWCPNVVADQWSITVNDRCDDEDVNRNGILDPGEDTNLNGRIEAGNIATVIPGTFTSDANGFGLVDIYYPQEYGGYLEVELQARTTVQGTEFAEKSVFLTKVLSTDVDDLDKAPPGLLTVPENFAPNTANCGEVGPNADAVFASPFGYNPGCTVFDFPN